METDEYAEVYVDAAGEHRWRLVAEENGNTLSDGGQGYADERDMLNGLARSSHRTPVVTESKGARLEEGRLRVVRVRG